VQISFNRYLDSLELTEDDFVVVKMDIEGMEYPLLKALLAEPRLSALIDELMVEMHYKHPEMAQHVSLQADTFVSDIGLGNRDRRVSIAVLHVLTGEAVSWMCPNV
jgi:hypothetical protein